MSTAVADSSQLAENLDRVAVSFGDATLDVIDLVLLGMLRGDWLELERRARNGLALAREGSEPPSKDQLHAAATSFRYAHGLVSAQEFLAWLRERALSVGDLGAFLERGLLIQRSADTGGPDIDPSAVSDDELARILWPEAVCSGMLAGLAVTGGDLLVADSIATTAAAPVTADATAVEGSRQPDVPPDVLERATTDAASGVAARTGEELHARLARLAGLQLAMARLRNDVAEPEALERVVAAHGLKWISVTGTELEFTTEGAALEARLLLEADGRDVETVARLAANRTSAPPRSRDLLIEDAPAELAGTIAAAAQGEVVGPWTDTGRHRVLLVEQKQAPSLETPSLRETAIAERLAEVLNRRGAGRGERLAAL